VRDDGDAAFRQFVLDQRRSLLRTAYLLTGDRAEDLVQLALLKTHRHWRGCAVGVTRRPTCAGCSSPATPARGAC
jgi:DNA-directed RNA polymerase specialized sigma24 family protein